MLMPRFIVCMIVLTLLFVNCSSSDEQEPRHYQATLTVDGLERSYLVNVPNDIGGDPVPLVLVLHGTGGHASQSERDYRWSEKSNKEKFIAVYPEGVRNDGRLKLRSWNAGRCCHYAMEQNVNDVQFIARLIETIESKYSIDKDRVFITGISNGGMLAYRLGCELSDKVAAIASVSGNFIASEPCEPGRPIPVLHIHSTLDTKVPYLGGQGIGGYYFPPADSGLQVLAGRNGCLNPPTIEQRTGYVFSKWTECDGNSSMELYLLSDGGHSWPGGLKPTPRSDEPSNVINATEVIWEFFKQHPRSL